MISVVTQKKVYSPHFIDESTEPQRRLTTGSGLQKSNEFEPRKSGSKTIILHLWWDYNLRRIALTTMWMMNLSRGEGAYRQEDQ